MKFSLGFKIYFKWIKYLNALISVQFPTQLSDSGSGVTSIAEKTVQQFSNIWFKFGFEFQHQILFLTDFFLGKQQNNNVSKYIWTLQSLFLVEK